MRNLSWSNTKKQKSPAKIRWFSLSRNLIFPVMCRRDLEQGTASSFPMTSFISLISNRHICRSGTQPLDDAICTWNIRNLRCPLRYQRSFYDYLLAKKGKCQYMDYSDWGTESLGRGRTEAEGTDGLRWRWWVSSRRMVYLLQGISKMQSKSRGKNEVGKTGI